MVDGPRQVVGDGPVLVGEEARRRRSGLQAVAIEPGRALGPVADPLLGPARGSSSARSRRSRSYAFSGRPRAGLALLLRLLLPLRLGRAAAPVGTGRLCAGKEAASPEADQQASRDVATSLNMIVSLKAMVVLSVSIRLPAIAAGRRPRIESTADANAKNRPISRVFRSSLDRTIAPNWGNLPRLESGGFRPADESPTLGASGPSGDPHSAQRT